MKLNKPFILLIFLGLLLSACIPPLSNSAEIVSAETSLPDQIETTPTPLVIDSTTKENSLTWETGIREIFEIQCADCHSSTPGGGFSITSYSKVLQGGNVGVVIIPGNPEESYLFYKLNLGGNHPGYLTKEQTDLVREWISNGAPE